jgi:hypothetical protein
MSKASVPARANTHLSTRTSTMVSSEIIRSMELDVWPTQEKVSTMANGFRANDRVRGCTHMLTRMSTRAVGGLVKSTDRAPTFSMTLPWGYNCTSNQFNGTWHENRFVKGKWIFPNGTVYEGPFDNNKPNG